MAIIPTAKLEPGVSVPLNISFRNLLSSKVTMKNIGVKITSIVAPYATAGEGCTAADFVVVQADADFSVNLSAYQLTALAETGKSQSLWPTVTMINSALNQDGCKGATVKMAYEAEAVIS